jgi:hypothetical protein
MPEEEEIAVGMNGRSFACTWPCRIIVAPFLFIGMVHGSISGVND